MRRWLKLAREKANLTHEKIADDAGISRSYYTNIENGSKTPSVEVAKSIANVLTIKWELFFEDKRSFKEHLLTVKSS
nr:helix-turn-helix transcriptional regulator [Bacillus sp. FJAT-28004]